jgi:hypothetical protein
MHGDRHRFALKWRHPIFGRPVCFTTGCVLTRSLLHCAPCTVCALGAAGRQVKVLHFGRGCVGITPEMAFGLQACLLYNWQAPAWCLLSCS